MSDKTNKLLENLSKNLPASVTVPEVKVDKSESDLVDDYEYSREKYKALVDKGTNAIDQMMELAMQSDHPRAFEVLGGMLKHVSDMTDKLVSLHGNVEKVKTIKKNNSEDAPSGPTSAGPVTNNNVFVGSTTDLQRYIIDQTQKALQPAVIKEVSVENVDEFYDSK